MGEFGGVFACRYRACGGVLPRAGGASVSAYGVAVVAMIGAATVATIVGPPLGVLAVLAAYSWIVLAWTYKRERH